MGWSEWALADAEFWGLLDRLGSRREPVPSPVSLGEPRRLLLGDGRWPSLLLEPRKQPFFRKILAISSGCFNPLTHPKSPGFSCGERVAKKQDFFDRLRDVRR